MLFVLVLGDLIVGTGVIVTGGVDINLLRKFS